MTSRPFRMTINVRQHKSTRRERAATYYWYKLPELDREYLLYSYGTHWLAQILRRGILIKRVKYV